MALPKYAPNSSHNIDTVGEMVEDNALRALNEDIRDDILIPLREQYMEELGMVDADVISMPGNFDRDGFGDSVAALVPGMANLIVFNKPGEDIEIFLADPFMLNRDDSHQGQEDDSWIAWIEDNYPAELNWNFVDDFSVYHLALGEVHCGTNVTRTPTANWWTDGGHLVRD
jgi:protein-arginine deiminase